MKKFIYLMLMSFLVFVSCNEEEVRDEIEIQTSNSDIAKKAPKGAIVIAPSYDMTGETDADNIESALIQASQTGGMVYLSDGDKGTNDHYYTSRNIVVEGFNGALMGEGKDQTVIHAVRKSPEEGFTPAFSPLWSYVLYYKPPVSATVFQFDEATGDVSLSKFSIIVEGEDPVELHSDYYGDDGTHVWTAIELIGGFFNTTIEEVRIVGQESDAYGNERGFNLGWGIHVMPFGGGPKVSIPPARTQGSLKIENVEVENTAYDAILFMDYRDGSEVSITNVSAINVGWGVSGARINDSSVIVSNVDVVCNDNFYSSGMYFWWMQSGPKISNCTIDNANNWFALWLDGVNQAKVTNTKFTGFGGGNAAIGVLWGSTNCSLIQNNYKDESLPGWTENSNGPGAVFLFDTANNYINENKFLPGLTVCDMVMDYGTNTVIQKWDECQAVAAKSIDLNKTSDPEVNFEALRRSEFRYK